MSTFSPRRVGPASVAASSNSSKYEAATDARTPGVEYEWEQCDVCGRRLYYFSFKNLNDPWPGDQMWVKQGEGREIILCEECYGSSLVHNHKKLKQGQQTLSLIEDEL